MLDWLAGGAIPTPPSDLLLLFVVEDKYRGVHSIFITKNGRTEGRVRIFDAECTLSWSIEARNTFGCCLVHSALSDL